MPLLKELGWVNSARTINIARLTALQQPTFYVSFFLNASFNPACA
jgi:hypothetical protein